MQTCMHLSISHGIRAVERLCRHGAHRQCELQPATEPYDWNSIFSSEELVGDRLRPLLASSFQGYRVLRFGLCDSGFWSWLSSDIAFS